MSTPPLERMELLLSNAVTEDAAAAGLPESAARVLLALGDAAGPVAMQELARRLARDATTATRFVDRAQRLGLVERAAGQEDRRRRLVGPTAGGIAARDRLVLRRQTRAARVAEHLQQTTGLGESQAAWFLSALVEALESVAATSPSDPPYGRDAKP